MSLEKEAVSQQSFGSLDSCLVEGDPEQRKRERRIRRRALATSIALQSSILVAIVLVPLFGKGARIAMAFVTPVPPYYHVSSPPPHTTTSTPQRPGVPFCLTCTVPSPASHGQVRPGDTPQSPGVIDGLPNSAQLCPSCIPMPNTEGPRPPDPAAGQPKRVIVTHLDPAMLIHRVEPVYPTLARQIGRGGRVELQAVIATDGSIQSLQVVSGDPFFVRSALDAVSQWRYKPTYLNGQPVEIDTFITVIYNLNH